MKQLLLFSLLFFLFHSSYSQTWQWAEQQGGLNPDNGNAICVDNVGNCYAVGSVTNYAKIFKYNSSGSLVWDFEAWVLGGIAKSITSDNNGHLYVSGDSSNQVKIVKIDTSGNLIWKISDTLGSNTGIVFDNAGYIYLSGSDDLITKYDTSGNLIWGRYVNAVANSIALDPFGNLCITGNFSGTAIFGTDTLIASGTEDIFLAKYDSSGTCLWAKRAGGNHMFAGHSKDCGYGIVVDPIGNIYFTGALVGTADFDSIIIAGVGGGNDIFLAKYNSGGNALWVKHAYGGADEEGRCIAIDNLGNILIGGSYVPTANFDGFLLPGWGNYDAFLAKYDNAGNFISALDAGEAAWNEFVYGIAADDLGNVFVTGTFYGTTYFGSNVLFSDGLFDMFTARIDYSTGFESHTVNPFDIVLYPNPAAVNITIEFETESNDDIELEIKNVLGQSIIQKVLSSGKQKQNIDITSLPNGFYLLQLKNGETFSSVKFIKQ